MPRFPYPDRKTFPQELQDFLGQVPEHLNFDMMSYSQSTIESFIRQGEAQYTGLELPHRSRELVILTTAAVTSAEYEFVQHVPISEAMGVDPQIREAIHKQDFDSALLSAASRSFRREPHWSSLSRLSLVLGVLALIATLLFVGGVESSSPTHPVLGLSERVFYVCAIVWLLLVGSRTARTRT